MCGKSDNISFMLSKQKRQMYCLFCLLLILFVFIYYLLYYLLFIYYLLMLLLINVLISHVAFEFLILTADFLLEQFHKRFVSLHFAT